MADARHDSEGELSPAKDEIRGKPRTGPVRDNAHGAQGPDRFRADLELVARARAGEPVAVRQLSERLRCVPSILAARNQRAGRPLDEHELADLAQEVLIRTWHKLASFSGRSRLETWVYGICRLELMNASRKQRGSGRASIRTTGDDFPEPATEDPTPEVDFEHVYASLERLGPPEEDIVRLKHFEGMTFEEIGQALEISPNTAKTQYYRGLERLRVLLRPSEGDEA